MAHLIVEWCVNPISFEIGGVVRLAVITLPHKVIQKK